MRHALLGLVLFCSMSAGTQAQPGPFDRMNPEFTLSTDGPGKVTITVRNAVSRLPLKLCLLDRSALEKVLQGLSDAHQVNEKRPCVPIADGQARISDSIGKNEWGKILAVGVSIRTRNGAVSRDSLEQSIVISLDGKGFRKPVTDDEVEKYRARKAAI